MKLLLLLLSAVATVAVASEVRPNYSPDSPKQSMQQLTCYDIESCTGANLVINDYISDLGSYGFDNRASCCILNGIWLLYEDVNYNTANGLSSAVFYAWGENYRAQFDANFNNVASSVRFTGAPDGYKYDTLNLYREEYFIGEEQFFYEDHPQFNIDNFGRSVVVTGCNPWTLYQYDNYQGESVCLLPSDTSLCYPSLFPTFDGFEYLRDQTSSARRGCFADKVIKGQPILPGEMKKFGGEQHLYKPEN